MFNLSGCGFRVQRFRVQGFKGSGFRVQRFTGQELRLPVSGSHRGLPYAPVFICPLTSVICLLLINL